jgi:ABC-2 type transport system ATP-binding protein
VLVTTHNMEEAQQCDRLVVMADGRIVATGTAGDIIAAAGIQAVTDSVPADLEEAFVAIIERSADAAGVKPAG